MRFFLVNEKQKEFLEVRSEVEEDQGPRGTDSLLADEGF